MKNNKNVFIILAVLVLLIVGASVLYTQLGEGGNPDRLMLYGETEGSTDSAEAQSQQDTSSEDETHSQLIAAPDFKAYDAEGNEVRLSDYIGKPLVLNFWASWCGPCQSEMPAFQEKYLALGDEVQFLMVNMTGGRETLSTAKAFISDTGYTFPVLYDTDYDAATVYGVYSLPATYFIDAQGYLVAHITGAISGDILQQGIDVIR